MQVMSFFEINIEILDLGQEKYFDVIFISSDFFRLMGLLCECFSISASFLFNILENVQQPSRNSRTKLHLQSTIMSSAADCLAIAQTIYPIIRQFNGLSNNQCYILMLKQYVLITLLFLARTYWTNVIGKVRNISSRCKPILSLVIYKLCRLIKQM